MSFYEVGRKDSAEKLLSLLRQPGIKVRDSGPVFSALERLRNFNVGFADAYLAGCGLAESRAIASFDSDFDKFKDVTRFEPAA